MSYRFELDETLPESFVRITREQLQDAESALTQEIESDPVGAVHSARKSVKKERALLRLMRGAVDPGTRRHENAALRDAARRLSGARDAEVMIATIDEIRPRYAGQTPKLEFDALRARLVQERQDIAAPEADGGSAEARAASELAAIRDRIIGWDLEHHGWRALEPGLTRTYQRGTSAFTRARKDPSVQNLHDWRKRVKDLWYQLRLLGPACGHAVQGQSKDAHELADLLGDDHDLAVLHSTLIRVGDGVPADVDAVLGLLDHRRAELQAQAMLVGHRIYSERPKAFRRRIRAGWKAGRGERRQSQRHRPADLANVTRQPVAH